MPVYNDGVGHAAAFGIRVYHRAGFVADLRRRLMGGDTAVRNIFGKYRPDEVLEGALVRKASPGDYIGRGRGAAVALTRPLVRQQGASATRLRRWRRGMIADPPAAWGRDGLHPR